MKYNLFTILCYFQVYNKVIQLYMCMCTQSCSTLCDPVTVAHQAPLSMEFSRQEYWSGFCHFLLRGSFQPRDGTCVSCISCIGSQILYHFSHLGSPLGIYVCIYTYLLAAQGSMWDLSSLTRDQTHTPSSGSTES